MVMHKSARQAYSLATHTVAKTRQVVMLYDGVIRFLRQASEAIDERRIEDRFNLLVRASNIITGLQSSLDFSTGGELAHTLHRFYSDASSRMLSVNFKSRDEGKKMCQQLIDDIKQMRDAWNEIDQSLSVRTMLSENTSAGATVTRIDSTVTFSA